MSESRRARPAHPSPEAIAVADEHVLDALWEAFETIRSYAVSGREAAGRSDKEEVGLRLRVQLRDCFRYAVELHNLLSPAPAETAESPISGSDTSGTTKEPSANLRLSKRGGPHQRLSRRLCGLAA